MRNERKRRCLLSPLAAVMFSLTAPLAVKAAPTATELDTMWSRGTAYLLSSLQADGVWGLNDDVSVATASAGVEVLNKLSVRPYQYEKAKNWLSNARAQSNDARARQIAALASVGVDASTKMLLLSQQATQSSVPATAANVWGPAKSWPMSPVETALAYRAWRLGPTAQRPNPIQAQSALCNLLNGQGANGAWGFSVAFELGVTAVSAGVIPSAIVLAEVAAFRTLAGSTPPTSVSCTSLAGSPVTHMLNTRITEGRAFLLTKQNSGDKGFSDRPTSTALETAVAIMAVRAADVALGATATSMSTQISNALDFLKASQSVATGGWTDEFVTAQVLNALHVTPASRPAAGWFTDTDGDAVPNAVEVALGTNQNVADSFFTGAGSSALGLRLPDYRSCPYLNRSTATSLSLAGGQWPFRFEVFSGALPSGLTLQTSTGVVTGTPTTLGLSNIQFRVVDAVGASAIAAGRIHVVQQGDWNCDGVVDGKDKAILRIILDDD